MTRHRSGSLVGMLLVALLGLTGCSTSPPDGITPVAPFEIERYLASGTRSPAWTTASSGDFPM